jgi:hypothetical protein
VPSLRRSAVVNTTLQKLNVPDALRALMSWAKLSPQHIATCFKYAGVFKQDGVQVTSQILTNYNKMTWKGGMRCDSPTPPMHFPGLHRCRPDTACMYVRN